MDIATIDCRPGRLAAGSFVIQGKFTQENDATEWSSERGLLARIIAIRRQTIAH